MKQYPYEVTYKLNSTGNKRFNKRVEAASQAEDGIRDSSTSRGLGDVYKRQLDNTCAFSLRRRTIARFQFVMLIGS